MHLNIHIQSLLSDPLPSPSPCSASGFSLIIINYTLYFQFLFFCQEIKQIHLHSQLQLLSQQQEPNICGEEHHSKVT